MSNPAIKPLRIGIIGIGVGATQIMPQMDALDEISIVAGADTSAEVRAAFGQRYPGAKVYESAEALVADPDASTWCARSPWR
jgi:predicted dehydrogenase